MTGSRDATGRHPPGRTDGSRDLRQLGLVAGSTYRFSPLSMKQLFGIPPKREDPAEQGEPQSARSNASGGSRSSADSPSFGKMKLVIKNTFIGGYDEDDALDDDHPPPTLARSASDSKLDCQSNTSSVVFWYPQRGGGSMSQSNSSVASRSDAGQDDHDDHPYHEPYHQLVPGRRLS
eukprot:Skav230607  [mRNA]  locus=scaffold168:402541:413172:- [translate_table: standard]